MTALPAWIDPEAWEGFCDFRKRQEKQSRGKIVWTLYAEKLILKELYKLHGLGHDANASLEQSIIKGWTDVYASKDKETPNLKREFNITREAPMTEEQKQAAERARVAAMNKLRPIRRVA